MTTNILGATWLHYRFAASAEPMDQNLFLSSSPARLSAFLKIDTDLLDHREEVWLCTVAISLTRKRQLIYNREIHSHLVLLLLSLTRDLVSCFGCLRSCDVSSISSRLID
jgi:hypothetical protein